MALAYDLNDIGQCKALAQQIKRDIDAYCEHAYNDGYRSHLGASVIGHPCNRYMWYAFRWCFAAKFSGRMLRLFNRGHREEARFIEWLDGIGGKSVDRDETGKQYRISAIEGHFGGSLDSRYTLPERYNVLQGMLLGEFKTSGTGSKFTKLQERGVILEKPRHYAQMCVYGVRMGLQFAVYMCINKNDDDLHVEVVKLDHAYGEDMIRKGGDIILSQVAPRKIASSPAYMECKLCDAQGVCWHGAKIEHNCRSCKHSVPIEGAQWGCNLFAQVIPADFIPKGCDRHEPIA